MSRRVELVATHTIFEALVPKTNVFFCNQGISKFVKISICVSRFQMNFYNHRSIQTLHYFAIDYSKGVLILQSRV